MNFVKLFGRYRAELEDAEKRRIVAEDDARYWRGKADALDIERREAVEAERKTHYAMEDWMSMRLTGFPIHGIAPPLPKGPFPADVKPEVPRSGRRLARDIVREQTAKAEEELYAFTGLNGLETTSEEQ